MALMLLEVSVLKGRFRISGWFSLCLCLAKRRRTEAGTVVAIAVLKA
jgi:hypothetical protein